MHSLLVPTVLNLGLGAMLGLVGGLLGIGGGLIAIPILGYFYGMDQHLAQGTALVMIAPNVLIGFLRYRQRHPIDLRSVALMSGFAMLSTYLAARLATGISAAHLHTAFAVFLVVLALYFAGSRGPAHPDGQQAPAVRRGAYPLLGVVSGAMSGIFTVGGGLIVVPALVRFLNMAQARAQGMALALVVPSALIALFTYAHEGQVSWAIGLPLSAGGILSVSTGVLLAHRFPAKFMRLLFSAVLLGTAALMLVVPY